MHVACVLRSLTLCQLLTPGTSPEGPVGAAPHLRGVEARAAATERWVDEGGRTGAGGPASYRCVTWAHWCELPEGGLQLHPQQGPQVHRTVHPDREAGALLLSFLQSW